MLFSSFVYQCAAKSFHRAEMIISFETSCEVTLPDSVSARVSRIFPGKSVQNLSHHYSVASVQWVLHPSIRLSQSSRESVLALIDLMLTCRSYSYSFLTKSCNHDWISPWTSLVTAEMNLHAWFTRITSQAVTLTNLQCLWINSEAVKLGYDAMNS